MALNCSIKRDDNNNILRVETPEGDVSTAYNSIRSIAPLNSEKALDIYLNLRENNQNIDKEDINILFKNKETGEKFENYREALRNIDGEIEIEINGTDSGSITPTFDRRTPEGFVNSYIRENILSPVKEIRNGQEYFIPEGKTLGKQGVNKQILLEDLMTEIGPDYNFTSTENGIQFNKTQKATFQGKDRVVNDRLNELLNEFYGIDFNSKSRNRKEIEQDFKNILQTLGVRVVDMDTYIKKYKDKNNTNSSVEALADITNKIIAFAGETISIETLGEEVAHFVIETLPKNQVEPILNEIHTTPEWTEFSEKYYETYSKTLKGDALENAVRREIAGKVLASEFLKGAENVQREGVLQRIYIAFQSFITKIRLAIRPTVRERADKLTKDLTNMQIKEGNVSKLLRQRLDRSEIDTLFKLKMSRGERRQARTIDAFDQIIKSTDEALRSLVSGNTAFSSSRSRLKTLQKQFNSDQYGAVQTSAIQELSDIIDSITSNLETVLTEKQRVELEDRVEELQNKKGEFSAENQERLNELNSKETLTIEEADERSKLIKEQEKGRLTEAELNELNTGIERLSNSEDTNYNNYQTNAYLILINQLQPLINQLSVNINKEGNRQPRFITDKIKELDSRIDRLKESYSENINDTMSQIIEDISDRYGFDESYREYAELWMKTAFEDTSYLHKMFGLMSNSQDPLLSMGSFYGQKIFNDTDYEATERLRHYQTRIRELVKEKDLKQLMDRGKLVDFYDQKKLEDYIQKEYARNYLEVIEGKPRSAQTEEEINSTMEKYRKRELKELTPEQTDELRAVNRATRAELSETYFKSSYYKDKERKYTELNISEATRARQNSYTSDRLVFLEDAIIIRDGKSYRDYSQLSKSGEERVEAIYRERQSDKQLYNSEGRLKNGIEARADLSETDAQKMLENGEIHQYVTVDGVTYYLDGVKDPLNHEAAIIALDLQRLDQSYFKELSEKSKGEDTEFLTDSFISELNAQPTEEAKLRFIKLNSTMRFSQKFWDSLDIDNSVINIARETLLEGEDTGSEFYTEAQKAIEDYSELTNIKRAILAQFRDRGRPFEIQGDRMLSTSKQEVDEIDAQIRSKRRYIRELLEERLDENIEADRVKLERLEGNADVGTSELNESFFSELEDTGMTLREFVRTRMPERTNESYVNFLRTLDRINNNYWEGDISLTHRRFIEKYLDEQGIDPQNSTNRKDLEIQEQLKEAYLGKIAPSYYKRFIPKELTGINTRLEDMSSSELIERAKTSEYFEIMPNYSYMNGDASSEHINPDYNPEFEGAFQPKKEIESQFRSKKFNNLFGEVVSEGKVQKNQNLYDALQILKEMKSEANENNNIQDASLLDVPQIYRKGVDRFWNTIKRPNIGNFVDNIKETVKYREDDLEFGTKVGGVNTIPVFYTKKLDNPENISDELWTTFSMNLQQSILHKHRRKNAGKFSALVAKAAQRDKAIGRENDSTVAFKMLKNYMDYALYGQKESIEFKVPFLGREYDLTKFARFLLTTFRMKNLAFSPIVPLTSLATESVQYGIDKRVGEVVDKDAGKLANKEFMRLAGGAVRDVGKIYSDSELNILMESLGVRKTADRYKNSNYGGVGRFMNQLPMGAHQAMTFPVSERIALSILYNHRIIDGEILDYNTFRLNRKMKDRKATEKDIRREWRKYENRAVREYLEVKPDSNAKFKKGTEKLISKPGNKTKEKYMQEKLEKIIANTRVAIQRMDTILSEGDRIEAQRNFATSFLTTHKQWLSLVTQNRFKREQRNLLSGQLEKGSYRTLYEYFGQIYRELFGEGKELTAAEQNRIETLNDKETLTTSERIELEELEAKGRRRGLRVFQEAWNGRFVPEYNEKLGLTRELKESDPEAYLRLRFELQDLQRRNMNRIAWDSAYILGVMAVAASLFAIADDDEFNDNYAIQMANYIMMRTVNQQLGNQTGVPYQWWETIKDPVVGAQNMGALVTLPYQLLVNGGEYEQGFYKGRNKRSVLIEKTLPGMKTFTDLSRLNDKADQYYYFNQDPIMYSGVGNIYTGLIENIKDNSN